MNENGSGLFRITRCAWFGRAAVSRLIWVLLTGSVLLAAFLLPLDKFSVRACVFLRLTGYPCPSCGWTRGFVGMAAGEWTRVIHDCPLAAVMYGMTAVIFAWNAAALILGVTIERGAWFRLDGKRAGWFLGAVILAVLANWMYRLGMGLK